MPSLSDSTVLRRVGLSLRAEETHDLPFLRALDAVIREIGVTGIGWSAEAKARFVDNQFVLQHRHFHEHYSDADFLIICHRMRSIGRLYVDRTRPLWRIIDIAIEPASQRKSFGRALLRWIQRAARRAGADGIDLHVAHDNRGAARLYATLGFVDAIAALPTHRRMTWRAVRPAALPAPT